MTTELLAMLGGGFSGFVFKLIGTMVQNQAAITEGLIKKQQASDDSADRAAARVDAFGAWTRRIIVLTVLFGVIIAPFILAHSEEGVTVASEYSKWFGFAKGTAYQTLHGYIILPEIKTAVISIISFYFGSAAVSK
jgi:hypothetical protein|tara:strand:- start:4416 stop:4823 length:408 start_codon:yes stop_codon:yes gene_type:complete